MVELTIGRAITSGGHFVDEDDSFEAGSTAVMLCLILNIRD
jgi:hypothetical protein